MAHESKANSALEAVSGCPRQQIHRPVKELSFEVANHVKAYLEHQRYEQAYKFLHSLVAAGTSISVPAKPYVGLLAPVEPLALASTLIVYPPITTRASSADAVKGSDVALQYLRSVQQIIRGPGLKTIRAAFTFSDSRRRGPAALSPPNSPASARFHDPDQLNDAAANAKSLWHCAEDFWHVVGWAFNCAVIHKKRWERWKLWLDIILSFLETDWDECIKLREPESVERQTALQDTLIWQYICSQEPLAGNTRKRISRAIFASADPQSLKEFAQVWDKETQEPKSKDTKKHSGHVDFETGDIGDYASDDEDTLVVKGRKTRNTTKDSHTSVPALENAIIPDYDAAVERFGGMDAVDLRQRLVALLSKVARELPTHFTSAEGLFDTIATQLSYFPVSILNLLTTTSRLSLDDRVVLNVTVLTALTSERYINYTVATPKQDELEQFLLPHRARKQGFADNAKVSLLLEQLLMYMMERDLLRSTEALNEAVEAGIAERSKVKGKRDHMEEEEVGEMLLDASSERLRGLLKLLSMTTEQGNDPPKAKSESFPLQVATSHPLDRSSRR